MIVLDASVAVSGLLNAGRARDVLAHEQLHAPHLIDTEVASVLRRHVNAGTLTASGGWQCLNTFSRLGITRYPALGVVDRVWALRENLSAYDATYVALAEMLACPLITADARLARAPGPKCDITILPA